MAANVTPKPTAAFAMSVLAGLLTIVAFVAGIGPLLFPGVSATSTMFLAWGSIAGIIVIAGSWLLYSNAAQRKLGSILVMVFSVISMNFIGLILGLIGGFLGYSFKSSSTTTSNRPSPSRGYNPP